VEKGIVNRQEYQWGNRVFNHRAVLICFFIFYSLVFADNPNRLQAGDQPGFTFEPLRLVSLGFTHLSTTYPVERYTFPNRDGTFADKGFNYYLSGRGGGNLSRFLDFNYDIRANNIEGVRFKNGSVFFRTKAISLEIGRNNIWLGHSYYGSLLLSNNAEPYTLVRFRTEKPFRVPYIGNFDYSFFHGWPRLFNIIGHQLSWYPVTWFEFNLKQTIVYTGTYRFSDYFKMFTGREANLSDGLGETNSRASFEAVFSMRFLSDLIHTITNARLYVEYGGEDLYAIWQKPDAVLEKDLWVGPFGFELLDTGILTGLLVQTAYSEFVFEYAQTYKNHYLFYDPYDGGRPYNSSWYRHSVQPPFQNNGAILGHHMGTSAEMMSFHYVQLFDKFTSAITLSRRHRWHVNLEEFNLSYKVGPPERQDSFTGILQYKLNQYSLYLQLTYNTYNNVDSNPDPVINRPRGGVKAEEFLVGIILRLDL
jgi:hypothetical protein